MGNAFPWGFILPPGMNIYCFLGYTPLNPFWTNLPTAEGAAECND